MTRYAIVKILDEKDESPTVNDFLPRYLQFARSEKRASSVRTEMTPLRRFSEFAKNPRIASVTIDLADRWRGLLLSRYSSNYARSCIATMRSFYDYAVSIKIVEDNPFLRVKLPRIVFAGRALENDDLSRFLPFLPLQERRMCLLSLYSGLRRSEIVRLEWSEVFDDHVIIPAHKSKSGRERVVWIEPEAISRLCGERGSGKVYDCSAHQLNARVTSAWKRSGLGRIRFHDLRHTYATRYYKRTKDLFALMLQCGWNSVQSTRPYQHADTRPRPQAVNLGYAF